jgi:hypothetical protein
MENNQEYSFIEMNEKTFNELKEEYKIAFCNKKDVFLFYNKELLTNYAKYLIEYLEINKNKCI